MTRVNIHLPDDLAKRARQAGLNVSGIAQEALERELRLNDFDAWLDTVRALNLGPPVPHDELLRVLDDVKEELGRAADKHLGEPGRTHG